MLAPGAWGCHRQRWQHEQLWLWRKRNSVSWVVDLHEVIETEENLLCGYNLFFPGKVRSVLGH